ncbi:MAG: molybdopterin synthase catalytic subunit MoaE [Pseudomonadota bacterium]
MSVTVQEADFDVADETKSLTEGDTDIGAVVTFTGLVRGGTTANPAATMTLEHYPGMTETELESIEAEALARWPLSATRIIHRVGPLNPGENIVLVITASRHRQAAFEAAAFLMDYLKTKAPFWKKETDQDGQGTWVDARESDDAATRRWTDTDKRRS